MALERTREVLHTALIKKPVAIVREQVVPRTHGAVKRFGDVYLTERINSLQKIKNRKGADTATGSLNNVVFGEPGSMIWSGLVATNHTLQHLINGQTMSEHEARIASGGGVVKRNLARFRKAA